MPTDTLVVKPGMILADRFRVGRVLGSGGMGAVYEIEHTVTKHWRALKLLHPNARASPETVTRFLREASAAGRIGDPHIVEIFDAGTLETGEPYIVMELLAGETLASRLARQGKLDLGELCDLVGQACRGVQAAHDAGIVHRDLKPDNLFVTTRDGAPFVKILDFGVSKWSPEVSSAGSLTQEGAPIGTPLYMAPEQLAGEPDIDARVDVYALGVILYKCAAGVAPFRASSLLQLALLVKEGESVPLASLRPDLPASFHDLVARAMARDKAQRLPSVRALGEALRAFGSAATAATLDPALPLGGAPSSPSPLDRAPSGARLRMARASAVWSRRERVRASAVRWVGRLGGGALAVAMAAFLSVFWTSDAVSMGLFGLAGAAFFGACGASLVALLGGRNPERSGEGAFEVRGEDLMIPGAGERRISTADVAEGWLEDVSPPGAQATGEVWQAVLRLRDSTEIAIRVEGRAQGEALLRAAGVAVADRVLRVPLRSAASMLPRGELLGVLALIPLLVLLSLVAVVAVGATLNEAYVIRSYLTQSLPRTPSSTTTLEEVLRYGWQAAVPALLAPLMFLLVRGLYRSLQRRDAVVGTDGVAIQRAGQRRFVAYDQIEDIARDAQGVLLILRGGKRVLLPTLLEAHVPLPTAAGPGPNLDALAVELPPTLPSSTPRAALYRKDVARREALIDRITQARASAGGSRAANIQLDLLDRKGDSVEAWRDRLRGVLVSGGQAGPVPGSGDGEPGAARSRGGSRDAAGAADRGGGGDRRVRG